MSRPGAGGQAEPVRAPTVFFLSDYGLADEFVGVVHAVVRRVVPEAVVIDLTHGVPPFDVRAGAGSLVRAVPHLGPGVVLGVVDPGVGGRRRGVAIEAAGSSGPRWFVGPDNGLLVQAAGLAGAIPSAWELVRPAGTPATFDGRDVFGPAAALLSSGAPPSAVARRIRPESLVRLPEPLVDIASGGRSLRAEVTWVDRFGNVQLAVAAANVGWLTAPGGEVGVVAVPAGGMQAGTPRGPAVGARRVEAFSELDLHALGLLSDANGQLALVVREGSAAGLLGVRPGDVVALSW